MGTSFVNRLQKAAPQPCFGGVRLVYYIYTSLRYAAAHGRM